MHKTKGGTKVDRPWIAPWGNTQREIHKGPRAYVYAACAVNPPSRFTLGKGTLATFKLRAHTLHPPGSLRGGARRENVTYQAWHESKQSERMRNVINVYEASLWEMDTGAESEHMLNRTLESDSARA